MFLSFNYILLYLIIVKYVTLSYLKRLRIIKEMPSACTKCSTKKGYLSQSIVNRITNESIKETSELKFGKRRKMCLMIIKHKACFIRIKESHRSNPYI